MLRPFALAVLVTAAAATAASGADLPPNSKLGAIFAKPHVAPSRTVVVRQVETYDYPIAGFAPQIDVRPIVAGYYGNPGSYYYRSYYGSDAGALWDATTRLPYACGFYGYC
jgi:hypothetical protein